MPRGSTRWLALAAPILAAVTAACGAGGGSGSSAATTTPAPAATDAATAAAPPATTTAAAGGFTLTSPAFADNGAIPRRFTCQGDAVSPELHWSGVPAGTTTLALLVIDPDAPIDHGFTHCVLTDIEPAAGRLAEGTTAGTPGDSSRGTPGYTGPCPPSGTHHYVFKLYALDDKIDRGGLTRVDLENSMRGHVIATAQLVGVVPHQ
jgi:Raf kinase inhibitor-like YbhB/YbcL family protein